MKGLRRSPPRRVRFKKVRSGPPQKKSKKMKRSSAEGDDVVCSGIRTVDRGPEVDRTIGGKTVGLAKQTGGKRRDRRQAQTRVARFDAPWCLEAKGKRRGRHGN